MPLDFKEPLTKDVKKATKEFVAAPKSCRPLQLDGEVLPHLIKKVGDVKSGRLSQSMVESYLRRHTLIFDPELLDKLFIEADYKKEGSLDARALGAALTGRYPKHELTKEWRQLAALLLGLPDLSLAEDHVEPKTFQGTFNADSFWTDTPPPLPSAPRRRRAKSAEPTGEFKTLSQTGTLSSTATGNATLLTTGGIKNLAPIAAEQTINKTLNSSTNPQCTFEDKQKFHDFSKGLQLTAALGVDTTGSLAQDMNKWDDDMLMTLRSASPKSTVRSWSAALPPTAISLNTTALQTLRNSIHSITSRKQDFILRHTPLSTAELDLKKTLGSPMDMQASLSRVEPVRPTKTLLNASYVEWQDYGRGCPTAPGRWFNEHPAVKPLVQAAGDHKYPWC